MSICQDGRVGLRRQFQVLVRKGMGSNPILDNPKFFPKGFFEFLIENPEYKLDFHLFSHHISLLFSVTKWSWEGERVSVMLGSA